MEGVLDFFRFTLGVYWRQSRLTYGITRSTHVSLFPSASSTVTHVCTIFTSKLDPGARVKPTISLNSIVMQDGAVIEVTFVLEPGYVRVPIVLERSIPISANEAVGAAWSLLQCNLDDWRGICDEALSGVVAPRI